MKCWKTKMALHHKNGTINTNHIAVQQGTFQGDSIFPLIFCMALFPITNILNRTKIVVKISSKNQNQINHLLYMDNVKLYANGRNNMSRLQSLLQTFSNDINMTFSIKKYAIIHINKGMIEKTNENLLPNLDPDTGYPYLGLLESYNFHQKIIKNEIKNKYYNRVRTILKAQLNELNTSLAMKLFAIPILCVIGRCKSLSIGLLQSSNRLITKLQIGL